MSNDAPAAAAPAPLFRCPHGVSILPRPTERSPRGVALAFHRPGTNWSTSRTFPSIAQLRGWVMDSDGEFEASIHAQCDCLRRFAESETCGYCGEGEPVAVVGEWPACDTCLETYRHAPTIPCPPPEFDTIPVPSFEVA